MAGFYWKYDGVLEYGGHIFILSGLSGKESRLFAFTVKADGKECIEDIVDLAERNLNGSRNTCLSLASVFIPANGML